jgi:hypothetical protein
MLISYLSFVNRSTFERGFGHGSIYKAEVRGQHLKGDLDMDLFTKLR